MKKIIIIFFLALFAFKSNAAIQYTMTYDAIGDRFIVAFTSTISYPTANVGPSYATVAFSSGYNTATAVATPINGGAWLNQDRVTGNTGSLNGYKIIGFATNGAAIVGGVTAGTSYQLFSFTFGPGNNCGGTLRLFVNSTDPADPDGAGGDFTSYLNIAGVDQFSTNSNTTFQTCASLTVPVKFSNFAASKKDNDALLNWTVQNQDANSNYFNIERSFNGVDFTSIGSVSVNFSSSTGNYNYKDLGIIPIRKSGLIFYRIKEVDRDGRFVFTEVRVVRVSSTVIIGAYPNPATSYTNLTIDLDKAQTIYITLNDAAGKEVQNLHLEGNAGFNITRLQLSKLSSGNYIITVKVGDTIQTLPIIKQ